MNKKILLFILGMLIFSSIAFAQSWHPQSKGENKKVLLQLRNLELLKILNLTNEQSMKVLPIIKDIDNLMGDSFESHRAIMNDLEVALDNNDKKEIAKNVDLLLVQESELNKKKSVLYQKLRDELGEENFGRYLLFMQSFGRDLQDKIRMMKEGDRFQSHPKIDKNK
ncbi:MAG: hypothetical protein J7M10_05325 [Candidatus Cloacimonetes bacterium]|nr:hypothetical protein [Candidatus Cloacimonadota bacterium]